MAEQKKVGPFRLTLRTEEVKEQVKQATLAAVTTVFELDIKPRAVEGSPVITGTNRRSIDTEVTQQPEGVKAELFTQSGYGGYIEVGTSKMKAQPYLWPAFQEGITAIGERVKEELGDG
jgi:HK97 gp10 family phage protein